MGSAHVGQIIRSADRVNRVPLGDAKPLVNPVAMPVWKARFRVSIIVDTSAAKDNRMGASIMTSPSHVTRAKRVVLLEGYARTLAHLQPYVD